MNTCKEVIENTVKIVNKRFPHATLLPKEIRCYCVANKRAWKAYCLSRSVAHKRRFNMLAARIKMSARQHRAAKEITFVSSCNKCAFFNHVKQIVSPSHSSVALHVYCVVVDNPYDIFNRTFAQYFLIQLLPIPGMSAHPIDNANTCDHKFAVA